jgi:hypothetical protein
LRFEYVAITTIGAPSMSDGPWYIMPALACLFVISFSLFVFDCGGIA